MSGCEVPSLWMRVRSDVKTTRPGWRLRRWRPTLDPGALVAVDHHRSRPASNGDQCQRLARVAWADVLRSSAFARSELPRQLKAQVVFDDVDFVTNDELRSALGAASATPEQVEEAVAINEDSRRRALQVSFLIIASISLLAIFPAARLPRYVPGELSAEDIVSEANKSGTP